MVITVIAVVLLGTASLVYNGQPTITIIIVEKKKQFKFNFKSVTILQTSPFLPLLHLLSFPFLSSMLCIMPSRTDPSSCLIVNLALSASRLRIPEVSLGSGGKVVVATC